MSTRFAALALVLPLLIPAPARASCPAELRAVPTHVLLARTCVSERGWRIETNDCAAIYEVASLYAETLGLEVRDAICNLSPTLHGPDAAEVSRPWLRDLAEDAHRPRGIGVAWEAPRCRGARVGGRCPDELSEISRRDAWLFTLEEARTLLDGELPPVCSEPPRAWGSDQDLRRRRAAGFGWREVSCGETANHFGSVLRRRT